MVSAVASVAFPADIDVRREHAERVYAEHAVRPAVVAPEVRARVAEPPELPTGARRVQRLSVGAGWRVVPTYARGTAVDRHGQPVRLTHSVAVRMWHPDGWRAVACWTAPVYDGAGRRYDAGQVKAVTGLRAGWTADGAWAWRDGEFPQAIALAASRKNPDAQYLTAWLLDPCPRVHTERPEETR